MAYFSVPEVSLNGIITVTRCCTLVFLERNIPFPGAQSCLTCTSKTTLHTEAQGRRIKMRCPVKVLTGIFHPILLSAF